MEFSQASQRRKEPAIAEDVQPLSHQSLVSIDKGREMLGTILIIILILALLGSLPTWGYSRGWGYYPSGGLGLIVIIIIILVLLGRI
jgi:uncharacterized protein DUF3309